MFEEKISGILSLITHYDKNEKSFVHSMVKTIKAKDPYTYGHCVHVADMAYKIADKLALKEKEKDDIFIGGLLHDLGKISINDGVLHKPNKLTNKEYDIIKRHPSVGAQIVNPIFSLNRVVPLIYHHHERYDGKGYLNGLSKKEIPIGARILSVADAYDAMISERPYRPIKNPEESLLEVKMEAGKQFDPIVIEAFVEIWEEEQRKIANSNQKNVLVIESDEEISRLIKRFLDREGFSVFFANNIKGALESIENDNIQLAIVDINSSNPREFKVINTIKKHNKSLPVLVLTGYHSMEMAQMALANGALDYLTRPLNMDELLEIVKWAFNN